MKLISIGLIFFFFSISFASMAGEQGDCTVALTRLNRLIDSNFFETRRGMEDYISLFPDSFLFELAKLNQHQHWVDAGSGEGFAIEDLFLNGAIDAKRILANAKPSWFQPREVHFEPRTLTQLIGLVNLKSLDEKPQVTGVSFHMERSGKGIPNIEYKVGKYFEQIPKSELKPADLITDLFGVMSYSPQVDQVLKRYHEILKPHSKAFVFVGDFVDVPTYSGVFKKEVSDGRGWFSNFAASRVKLKGGNQISLISWISQLPGFKAKLEERVVTQPQVKGVESGRLLRRTLILEKTEEQLKIPALRLIESDESKPPLRVFEEAD